eukprot:TRINITY_DN102041_c0_g1_i1.p1 TRINITY_DN102041_c0_g1~~TRINITY_DN102041_c0_g1_i1.p1  ORF type:complete len:1127 (-),score=185.87 TRINITY_DN102041_c0_g1_i1:108-3488(-)
MGCCQSTKERTAELLAALLGEDGKALDSSFVTYLQKHEITEILSQAVRALSDSRPADPLVFLGEMLTKLSERKKKVGRNTSSSSFARSRSAPRGTKSGQNTPRLLVLTDVGEEIDDEAALWLLAKYGDHHLCRWQADVVFVTGDPMQRAMRWANILNSVAGQTIPGTGHMRYFKGPSSDRHVRYRVAPVEEELESAGLGDLSFYEGGQYDVVLQISPLSGFSADFDSPPQSPEGALSRINRRTDAKVPMYICVGQEGSTNFPKDKLHEGFKHVLARKGFSCVHVDKLNYTSWRSIYFNYMPDALVELVLDDEWNKAVGRISPMAANLFVRFRVNTAVNYELVGKAFAMFQSTYAGNANFVKAMDWWFGAAGDIHELVRDGYVQMSRDSDNKQEKPFGNANITDKVKGMNMTWKSIMSKNFQRDLVHEAALTEDQLDALSVDDIMGWAITLMTKKLLLIYAFNAYTTGVEPSSMEYMPYLTGSSFGPVTGLKTDCSKKTGGGIDSSAPLDFRNFPHLRGDLSQIKKEVVGSPMYDPSGMLIALVALDAVDSQRQELVRKLRTPEALADSSGMMDAMSLAFREAAPYELLKRFFSESYVKSRLLVLTDGGGPAGDEAALWLLVKQLEARSDFTVDVVFMTGEPLHRAMRWASILKSLGDQVPGGSSRIRYLLGPGSDRKMKYQVTLDEQDLDRAGLGELRSSPFLGGQYNVILQCSPLGEFSDNFLDQAGGDTRDALLNVWPRPGAPLYFVVGEPGSENFPDDKLHAGFKNMLTERGFTVVHMQNKAICPSWDSNFLRVMPSKLRAVALTDEWNKITHHALSEHNLYQKFKRDTNTKFDLVCRAYEEFEKENAGTLYFSAANDWWCCLSTEVKELLEKHYLSEVRDKCRDAADDGSANPRIIAHVKGQQFSWKSAMSPRCLDELLEDACQGDASSLDALPVHDAMCWAMFLTVGRLLRIYAADCFMTSRSPNNNQISLYLEGSATSSPLHFNAFPNIRGLPQVKATVVGSKLSDAFGVMIAISALAASPADIRGLKDVLSHSYEGTAQSRSSTATASGLPYGALVNSCRDALQTAFQGESTVGILQALCTESDRLASFASEKAGDITSSRSLQIFDDTNSGEVVAVLF